MKLRFSSLLVLLLVVSVSLSLAQAKDDHAKKEDAKSCCVTGTKASMTKAGTTQPTMMLASDKKSGTKTVKTAKHSGEECTEAEKAECAAKKGSMTKAGTKTDCCKEQVKQTKVEKKSTPEKSEAKGTN